MFLLNFLKQQCFLKVVTWDHTLRQRARVRHSNQTFRTELQDECTKLSLPKKTKTGWKIFLAGDEWDCYWIIHTPPTICLPIRRTFHGASFLQYLRTDIFQIASHLRAKDLIHLKINTNSGLSEGFMTRYHVSCFHLEILFENMNLQHVKIPCSCKMTKY